ncbi:MAG: hypothetical protein IPK91_06065 [Saprospiraceae bacterium]|nr:hypothetical protein [Saprospiraceae bacterium]
MKHGGFPWIESKDQFDYSIKHALIGSYKAAIDHLRSCLELSLVSVYFAFQEDTAEHWSVQENIKAFFEKEKRWLNSLSNTPFFSEMKKLISENHRIKKINQNHTWLNELSKTYGALSDYTHIKGFSYGIQNLSSPDIRISGSSIPKIETSSLDKYLCLLIQTVEHIVVLTSLYNPIILIELPLTEKFGINEPIGFIHPGQTEIVNELINVKYKIFFEQLKNEDEDIASIIEWVNSRPDLTDADIQKQIEDFNDLLYKKEA